MEFTFETVYKQDTFTAMARALRKTVRQKHSKRSHKVGWLVVLLAVLLLLLSNRDGFTFNVNNIVTIVVTLMIVAAQIWEDQINGFVAMRRTLPGTEQMTATFTENGYHTVTAIGNTDWNYENIMHIAETADYFVFIFSTNHAQLHDKRQLSGGRVEAFRSFITAQTGKVIEQI